VREKLFPIDPPLKKTIVKELEIEEINSDDLIEQEEIISWQKKN
jgi:hypothetical protein